MEVASNKFLPLEDQVSNSVSLNPLHHPVFAYTVWKLRGNLELINQHLDAAELAYFKALSCLPLADEIYVNLGTLELQRQNDTEAQDHFRKALELDIKNSKAWAGLALVYESYGDQHLALACIRKAIDLDGANTSLLHILKQLSIKNDCRSIALEALMAWADKNEYDRQVSLDLIELFVHECDFLNARITLEYGLLISPTDSSLLKWDEILTKYGV